MLRAYIVMVLSATCVGVYLSVLFLSKLIEAMTWENTGKDFPEYELWGRDYFDDEEEDEYEDDDDDYREDDERKYWPWTTNAK